KAVKPAEGFDEVCYPGELGTKRLAAYKETGIEIVDDLYDYLVSDAVHFDRYDHKNKFAE
ncbi:MAG: ureidoglycolate dehydrogenase, partial [Eubacterium sp.]